MSDLIGNGATDAADRDVDDALLLQSAVALLLERKPTEARRVLRELPEDDPVPAPVFEKGPSAKHPDDVRAVDVDRALAAQTYDRDGWRCRYCGRRLVVPGVIELVGILCPKEFRWESDHMPIERTHPAAIRVYPNVDHVLAGAAETELVAACTPCNERKGDRVGWTPRPAPALRAGAAWDGLRSRYRPLFELADAKWRGSHSGWMDVLGV
jgi:hypothetical protein